MGAAAAAAARWDARFRDDGMRVTGVLASAPPDFAPLLGLLREVTKCVDALTPGGSAAVRERLDDLVAKLDAALLGQTLRHGTLGAVSVGATLLWVRLPSCHSRAARFGGSLSLSIYLSLSLSLSPPPSLARPRVRAAASPRRRTRARARARAARAWMPHRLAEQRAAGERGAGSSVRAIAAVTVVVAVVVVVVCAADHYHGKRVFRILFWTKRILSCTVVSNVFFRFGWCRMNFNSQRVISASCSYLIRLDWSLPRYEGGQ